MIPQYTASSPFGDDVFSHLINDIDWLEVTANRKEYFMANETIEYQYGTDPIGKDGLPIFFGKRTYRSSPYSRQIKAIEDYLNEEFKCNYNVCFLNRYDDARCGLGWHADDSPEMNPLHPIAVVSFGAEREIWWKGKEEKGTVPPHQRQSLGSGSIFIMPAGFQADNLHRIPKSDKPCSIRCSLTFRNYSLP